MRLEASATLGGTSEAAQLAGEMHATEWALGDRAHDVSAGTDKPADVLALAERLELLARVLRVHAQRAGGAVSGIAEGSPGNEGKGDDRDVPV